MKKLSKKIPKRRRREKKTDYSKRLKLLKSGDLRLVVRNSLNNIRAQIVKWEKDGDMVLEQSESKDLEEFGWKGHRSNIPAAYLTGYLIGKRGVSEDIKRCILDIGLQKNTKESKLYATVKGVIDAGIEVPVGEKMLPSEDRLKGKHIEEYASKMKEGEKNEHFSSLIGKGLDPENVTKNFDETKEKIDEVE